MKSCWSVGLETWKLKTEYFRRSFFCFFTLFPFFLHHFSSEHLLVKVWSDLWNSNTICTPRKNLTSSVTYIPQVHLSCLYFVKFYLLYLLISDQNFDQVECSIMYHIVRYIVHLKNPKVINQKQRGCSPLETMQEENKQSEKELHKISR